MSGARPRVRAHTHTHTRTHAHTLTRTHVRVRARACTRARTRARTQTREITAACTHRRHARARAGKGTPKFPPGVVLISTAKAPHHARSHTAHRRRPFAAQTVQTVLNLKTGRSGENTFFGVPEKGGLADQPKKGPRIPRWTPQPGPGTVVSRRGHTTQNNREMSSPILYDTGEVILHLLDQYRYIQLFSVEG